METSEMMNILFLLLMLSDDCCSGDQIFERKSVRFGENIKLNCSRRGVGTLFWIRLVSGNVPEILGRSFSSESADQRIGTATEPGIFALHITKVKQNDTAVYFCMKTLQRDLIFLKGIHLKVEGPEPTITTAPPSNSVRQEHTVKLQCSVLHDSQTKTCSADDNVFCLSADSHQYHLNFNGSHLNGGDENEKNSTGISTKQCFYSYIRNFSSSDSQTYYCAVATCVESVPKNETKCDTEAVTKSQSKMDNIVLCLLCATLAISLIVIASLVYSIKILKKKLYGYCKATVALQTNVIIKEDQENLQTDEDSLVYSAPTFKKASKSGTKDATPTEEETIYTDVKALGLD